MKHPDKPILVPPGWYIEVLSPQQAKDIHMSEGLYPRRRDVRGMCEEMLNVLRANSVLDNDDKAVFGRAFLTGVRDLMREGVPFEDAVGAFTEAEFDEDDFAALDDELSDLFTDFDTGASFKLPGGYVNKFDTAP